MNLLLYLRLSSTVTSVRVRERWIEEVMICNRSMQAAGDIQQVGIVSRFQSRESASLLSASGDYFAYVVIAPF